MPKGTHPTSKKQLKPAWKKGESGNPNGKPKGTIHLKTRLTEFLLTKPADSQFTYEELFIRKMGANAIQLGKERTQQVIWEAYEGKAAQTVDVTSKGEKIDASTAEKVQELSDKFDDYIRTNDKA